VYEEQSLHFVMSKAIRSTSIIKTFSLLNNFSSTPVAISQIGIPKNATQYFKVNILMNYYFYFYLNFYFFLQIQYIGTYHYLNNFNYLPKYLYNLWFFFCYLDKRF